uniref:Upstream stimulatory factor 2 n=1 Tax=Lygus hesperus TaxID=30085 RepID=A0A0A9VYU4_LYGHE
MDILRRSLQPNRRDKVIDAEGTLISQVEEETSLGSVEDATTTLPVAATLLDTSIDASDADDVQYKFIDENVTTYRVVQFGDTVDTINANAITSSTTLSGSPSGGSSPQSATIYTGPLNGVYVINSSDVFPVNERPKTVTQIVSKPAPPSRDDKRRATHNEVERRRRDKINNWIMKLGKIMPECKSDSSKGSYEMHSKGGILAKACDYIVELRDTNDRLLGFVKENQQLLSDVQSLGRQCEDLRRENEQLRNILAEHGITHTL